MKKDKIIVNILDPHSIQIAQERLRVYARTMELQTSRFVRELSEVGIMAAAQNTGDYEKYIRFSYRLQSGEPISVITASDAEPVEVKWLVSDGNGGEAVKTAKISPILMSEFGSGFRAVNPKAFPGVGQGTFPGQTHAFDDGGWYYKDYDTKKWMHSKGYAPTQPMEHLLTEMENKVREVAGRVFV